MNVVPPFTDIRSHLSHKFFALRAQARRDAFVAKLIGKKTELASFPEKTPDKSPNRIFTGTEDILVEKIVGTVNRRKDFDSKFRPLNLHLRDRWVDVYLALERDTWPPILVHKVGENYYVEDGHHRVSIAQLLGMTFIPANVWAYSCQAKEPTRCQPELNLERTQVQVYASVTE